MAYPEIVESADAATDGNPGEHRQGPGAQALGQGSDYGQALGDEVAGIGEAMMAVARRERRRHRQPRTIQTVGQLPFFERPRALLALPEEAIARDARDQAAAPIVAQHVTLARGSDEVGGAAAARHAVELAARRPVFRIEPVGTQIAHTRGVI